MPKVTKRIVDAAEPRERQYFIWDTELQGFGIRVSPGGRKAYYVDYRNAAGARKRMALGAHGALTTEEARKMALVTLAEAVKGEDPATERATRRKSLTVQDLCEQYLEAAEAGLIMGKRGRAKKDSTLYVDRGRIERHVIPLLGKRLVRDLTSADINRFMRDLIAGKTAAVVKTKARGKAVVEGGAGTAARTVGLLGGILSYAVSEGVISTNPVRGVKRPADKRRTRRLTADEYAALGKALAEAADNPAEQWQGIAAVRLLLLTGCRLGEVQKLRWSEVDLAGQCLRLEDSKEGASVRPVGKPVVEMLEALPRFKDSPFVLPATRGRGAYTGVPKFWQRTLKAASIEGITPHTLRHSFGSEANDLGFTEPTVAAMLGHSIGSVTGRYIHHLDAALISGATAVANKIKVLLEI